MTKNALGNWAELLTAVRKIQIQLEQLQDLSRARFTTPELRAALNRASTALASVTRGAYNAREKQLGKSVLARRRTLFAAQCTHGVPEQGGRLPAHLRSSPIERTTT